MKDGSRALAAAVLQQALTDAPAVSTAKSADRQTARSLLFSDRREWAEARALWFDLAGLREPSRAVLARAVDVVNGKDARRVRRAATKHEAAVAWLNRGATTRRESAAACEALAPASAA